MQQSTGAQPYLLNAPVTVYPITVAELKAWLKISSTAEDSLLQMIIAGVTDSAEKFTKREFCTKEFLTYRDVFGDFGEDTAYSGYPSGYYNGQNGRAITLRRSRLQTIVQIEYLIDGVWTVLASSAYALKIKDSFSQILPASGCWPITDSVQQCVRIAFTAGYGLPADVPQSLRMALLAHATAVYSNRGDCDCTCESAPQSAMLAYRQYRLLDFAV